MLSLLMTNVNNMFLYVLKRHFSNLNYVYSAYVIVTKFEICITFLFTYCRKSGIIVVLIYKYNILRGVLFMKDIQKIELKKSKVFVPPIAIGCMRLNSLSKSELESYIKTTMELGLNFYDHADIYGRGECETAFSDAINMNSTIREKMIIQSKTSIVPSVCYNASTEYIINSVDGILKRLKTDYLDFLLLHRPDALVEPEEVAEAFNQLKKAGKVKHFGVSNHNANQIQLLNKYCDNQIGINQLQFSIAHSGMIDSGINVNMTTDGSIDHDGSILDFCRLNDITIQAWSPFQYGRIEGVFLDNDKYPELNKKVNEMAEKYNVTNSAIAIAWILRHPAKIQAIVGSTNIGRVTDITKALDIELSREDWYSIYLSGGKILP